MTKLETQLQHLLRLMEAPFTDGWRAYCWARAKELAEQDPDYSDLPSLLALEMKRRAGSSETPEPQLPKE